MHAYTYILPCAQGYSQSKHRGQTHGFVIAKNGRFGSDAHGKEEAGIMGVVTYCVRGRGRYAGEVEAAHGGWGEGDWVV